MKVAALASLLALPSAFAAVAPLMQCGGQYYTGDTTCVAGYTCVVVSALYSQCRAPTATSPSPSPSPSPKPTLTGKGIDGRIKAKGKMYWGNILDGNTFNNPTVTNILKNEFGQLTAENSMKMDSVQGSQGNFNFGGGDRVVNFAQQNGMIVRGHTLVWHSQLPGWVNGINNRGTLTNVIQTHVSRVMGHYKGKIYAWDVCNEILNEDGSMRGSVYSRVMGEDFVGVAFKAAKAADPDSKLYINDYNLDVPDYGKVIGMVDKVTKWKAAGAPIEGIGTQAHYSIPNVSRTAEAALVKLASVEGVEVALTELDIYDAGVEDYTNAVNACLNVEKCVGITSWGVRDPDSWISSHNPLMFDYNGRKKPAYQAAWDALA